MPTILIRPTSAYKHTNGDKMMVSIQEFIGAEKGRKRQMLIEMPIHEEDLIEGLRVGWGAETALLQQSHLIERIDDHGKTLLIVP